MSTGPFFDKAWKRREYERAVTDARKALRAVGVHLPDDRPNPKPKPPVGPNPKGYYVRPWNWTDSEQARLNAWNAEPGSVILGGRMERERAMMNATRGGK